MAVILTVTVLPASAMLTDSPSQSRTPIAVMTPLMLGLWKLGGKLLGMLQMALEDLQPCVQ